MNALVVVGTCLKQNSSANLCHISYINGLIDLGYAVDLIAMDEKDIPIDESIVFPKINKSFLYYGLSIYEKISRKKNISVNHDYDQNSYNLSNNPKSIFREFSAQVLKRCKTTFLNSYGAYNVCKPWSNRAGRFKSDTKYDFVISLSYPPASNRTVKKLIDRKRVIYKKWIQIWEDPWSIDLFVNGQKASKFENAERKILKYSDRIVYVSPLTLHYQQKKFPESADRMRWFPVPAYYDSSSISVDVLGEKTYGYFGDYSSKIRNILPLYEAAKNKRISLNICGNSNLTLTSVENINVYPRLKLSELKPIEDKTNVLIFVANLYGGQIPGKIYQYAATNKIVLFILDGTEEEKKILKEFFSQFNRFIFCDNNEESIAEAIEKIEANDFENVINRSLDDFKPSKIVKQILESVKE